ncbi:arsenate reductase ArsC [Nonomuraea sp. NPDC049400]|uniref:arsenate reductase ArsC n=1 Tax=Nonomuraea sp. NPDC049400 TaxID=3364352 RepID=UPI0037996774
MTDDVSIDPQHALLTERFARQRLRALARVEGKDTTGTPIVLFLCVHNAGRSQMALGFFTHLAGDRAIGWSGGSDPGERINPSAIEAMRERGIDITGEFPKPWTTEIAQAADVIVTMGCGDACPVFPGKQYADWRLPDPAGQSVEAVRPIRDEIERRVRTLLADPRRPRERRMTGLALVRLLYPAQVRRRADERGPRVAAGRD